LARSAESLSLGTLAKSVIENYDVGPLGVFFPILGFGDEAIGDVALFFGFDVVADVVAFFEHLPGDVTDETGERDKEKFAFVHFERPQILDCGLADDGIVVEKTTKIVTAD